jgi:NADPH:quinone reductase-like Zn-dependent oxidoreductase
MLRGVLTFKVKSFDAGKFPEGHILGCDFAGTVVKTGDDVSRLVEGDVIAGLIWGGRCQCIWLVVAMY